MTRKNTLRDYLIVGFLAALIYAPSFNAPFQFDDGFLFYKNTITRNILLWEQIWTYDPSRFLTNLTFTFNYIFWGNNVFYYHLINFMIHLSTGWIIFLLLTKMSDFLGEQNFPKKIIPFSVLIFLLHPIQTSAVTYIIQRATLLAGFFYLATLFFYCRYAQKKSLRDYASALGCCFLGVFCKPIIFTLPLVLVLFEKVVFAGERRNFAKIIVRVMPFAVLVLIVPILLALWKYKNLSLVNVLNMAQETDQIGRGEYFLTQLNVIMTYLRLLFVPVNQNLDYDFPLAHSLWEWPTGLSFVGIGALLVLAVQCFNKFRLATFCVVWFLLTLSLESSIFPITDVIFEHRLYLPIIGFAVFFPAGVFKILRNERSGTLFLAAVIILYGALSFQRNFLWSEPEKFLLDIASKSPKKARVYHNLGKYYLGHGRPEEALANFEKALELDPQFVPSLNNIGNIKIGQGKNEEALVYFNKAIQINPAYEIPYFNRATVYLRFQRPELALLDYNKVLELNPYFVSAYTNRGNVLAEHKEYEAALRNYTRTLVLDPQNALAYNNRAVCYYYLNDYQKAYADLLAALKYGYPVEENFKKSLLEKIARLDEP